MARRTYTTQQRQEAIELYRTDGPTTASRTLGIDKGLITRWAQAAGVTTVASEKNAAAVMAAQLKWAERRAVMVDEAGAAAQMALQRAVEALEDGKGRDAKDLALTMAILIDKAQLMSGEATSRTESRTTDAMDREIAKLIEAVK